MSKDNNEKKSQNIFEIMDGIMFQLNKTKKMFMFMILTILIIPPLAIVVTVHLMDAPFDMRFEEHRQIREQLGLPVSEQELTKEQIWQIEEEFKKTHGGHFLFKGPQLLIFLISMIWLGIGIRQWIVLSKFSKKYENFKKKQEEIDKKLDEADENGSSNQ